MKINELEFPVCTCNKDTYFLMIQSVGPFFKAKYFVLYPRTHSDVQSQAKGSNSKLIEIVVQSSSTTAFS